MGEADAEQGVEKVVGGGTVQFVPVSVCWRCEAERRTFEARGVTSVDGEVEESLVISAGAMAWLRKR